MKKSIKYLSLVLAIFFLIAGCAAIAYAEGENGEQPADPGAGAETPADTPAAETPADTPADTPAAEPDPGTGTDTGTGDNSGAGTTTDNSGGTGYDTSGGSDYSYDNSNQYDNSVDYSGNYANENNNYVYSDETAGSVSNSTNVLYNSSGISAAEAAPNEWSDIKLNEKTVTTGVADFSSIKTNTSSEDNGQLILYLGYILIGLSVLGILYFIIATIAHRKAYNNIAARENARANYYGGAHSQAAKMNERERGSSAAQRSSQRSISHYNDEIKAYNRRVSSKANTGEVYVPRRAK